MGNTPGSNPIAIMMRRKKVDRMRYSGLSATEIAVTLGVSVATVKRDCRHTSTERKAEAQELFTAQGMAERLLGYFGEALARLQLVWENGDNREKIACEAQMRRLHEMLVTRTQSLGLTPKVPEKLHITSVMMETFDSLDTAIRDEINAARRAGDDALWSRLTIKHLGHLLPAPREEPIDIPYEEVIVE